MNTRGSIRGMSTRILIYIAAMAVFLSGSAMAQANQPPVLNAIGNRAIDEGVNLNFSVSATDTESIPIITTSALPTGATFTSTGTGTETFDWTPDFTQAGPYTVTFYATDDSSSVDSEVVSIMVNQVNLVPVMASIGSKNTNEGVNLNFSVSATDADGTTPIITTSALPTGATFTSTGTGTETFDWTPDFTQSGPYTVTFYATDDSSAVDSEVVTITVGQINLIPVLATIGAKNTDEGVNLNFAVSATDADGTTPTITTSALPTGATFTSTGTGTETFDWTPGFTQSGPYTVTFYATDDSSAVDSEVVTITVGQINLIPVLATIGAKNTDEGVNLNFAVSATDADGTTPTITTSALPTGATFTSTGTGTETFDWTPGFTQSGPYTVTFYATDDSSAVDSEVVSITVNQVNLVPVLVSIGSKNTNEGVNLNFSVSASDADGTTPIITTSALPSGATFTSTGTGTETFDWTPDFTQSGPYTVTFYATDDSSAVDSEVVSITVNQVNLVPVLASIGSKNTNEGVNLNFTVSATDADGTTPIITTSALPTGATFTSTGTGTETFDWTPGFTQSGPYTVTFYATDDSSAVDSEVVTITVGQINLTPVLATIGAKNTDEGVNLNFTVSATDADGTTPIITTSALPTGATFTSTATGTETFDWTPGFTQSGPYTVTFYATDDSSAVDSEVVSITVNQVNLVPVLALIGAKNTNEGVNLNFSVSASDADGTTPTITTSALPTGATFTSTGTGTETFDWTPDFTQSGPYTVTFYATDDSSAVDSEVVSITVNQVNLVPVLVAIGAKNTDEGVNLNFTVSATDADGTTPIITTSALPTGATFTSTGTGTETFDWTPGFTQSGPYTVTFYATDDSSAVDSEVVSITVNQVNLVPVLALIGAKNTNEGVNLNFSVSASDADGTTPIITTSALPTGATFTSTGTGTETFDWTPDFTQSGPYTVTFYATDDSSAVDSEVVSISVNQVNLVPVLATIGAKNTDEGVNLNFAVSATDADGTTPTITTSALPTGATFTSTGTGTETFDWTPGFTQSGPYTVTFYATDDSSAVDSEVVSITVNQVNLVPVLVSIGSKNTNEGVNLNFSVSASDADGTTPIITTSALPNGATFTSTGTGTETFDWTPGFTQSGPYTVTFYATDDSSAVDSEVVSITVNQVNLVPVLASIGSKNTNEGVNLNFAVSATDADGTTPIITTSALPTGATFTSTGTGTETFDWTPGFTQSGPYTVTFYATDDSSAVDSEVVSITVNQVNLVPVLAAIGAKNTDEGVNLNFAVSATDADGTTPIITTSALPTGATFTSTGTGTETFDWTPGFTQSGPYTVTFYATDDSSAVDSEVVTITVGQINLIPVLATIGAKNTDEGVNLNFAVSATDADGTTPTITTSALPTGATFTSTGTGTETFDWTPGFTQSGPYTVTFYATDDSSAVDSEVVSISVNQVNLVPVLASIDAKNTDEGVNLNFTVSATDADGTIPIITTSALPTGATFTSTGTGTETFDWTPGFTQSGPYTVTFYATDDSSAVDSEVVTITVGQVNLIPVLATIGAKNTDEGVNLNFSVSATDADGTTPIITTSALPSGATFTSTGTGTETFDWTPGFTQSGPYTVTFYATDDSSAVDSEVVSITVNQINQPPILAAIGSRSTTEGINLNFGISVSDIDGTIAVLTHTTLPGGATFNDNGNNTGTFNWTPTFLQSGNYSVTFYATDDSSAVDSEVVSITVIDGGNQAPVLASIGTQSTIENVNLNFVISATDIESTPILTTSTLPTGATFNDNGNGTGTFDWTPTFLQSGPYTVTFYATDDSLAVDSEIVTINIIEAGNQLPVLAAIGSKSAPESVNLSFGVSATDIESIPSLSTSSLPDGAGFTDNHDGTGVFSWTPNFTQSGVYIVTFYATDDSLAIDSENVTIRVFNSNQAPVLATIGSKSINEGANLNFAVSATDPNGTIPIITSSALPSGATFTSAGGGTGTFNWTPNFTQSGTYSVTFYATDDSSAVDSEVVSITVNQVNLPPILAAIGSRSTTENINLNFAVNASDSDGDIPALTTSSLPTGAGFTGNGDGTGTFNWTPTFLQSGPYTVTFYATDDSSAVDSEIVTINVIEAGNQLPVLAAIGSKSADENVNINFTVSTTDIESTPTITTSLLPSGATITATGTGTETFNWTPDFGQSGIYNITFYATDDSTAVDSEVVTFTINQVNLPPVLAAIGNKIVDEGVNLNFTVSATDPDGTIPTLTTSVLPSGAAFSSTGTGTETFNWTPDFTQAGPYSITFYATDDSLVVDSEVISIIVNQVNLPPVLAAIGPRSVTEGVNLSFGISAGDADGFIPVLTSSSLPSGASFSDNGNGAGSFGWTPVFNQSGIYTVTFYATDDSLAVDSEVVTITVVEAGNQTPVLAAVGNKFISEGVNLNFNVSATDADSTTPALTTSALPSGAGFTDNGNGTANFTWTPNFTQAGAYSVTFYASDGVATDSEQIYINVFETGNQAPVWTTIGNRSTTEGVNLNFGVTASDPDETNPVMTTTALPSGATFVDNHNGTGTFNWTPGFTQSGSYNISFYATDGVYSDTELVTITVNEAGNQTPVLAAIGPKSTTENVNLSFGVSASDADLTIPHLTTSSLPAGAVFTDENNGTGSFSWTPTFLQSGIYSVTFYATDDTAAVDSEVVTITVNEGGNQLPILAAIGARSTNENINLNFIISATDIESTPSLMTSALPAGAVFVDNGNGTGAFNWTPTFLQSGTYDVTFYATDDSLAVDSEKITITVNEAGNQLPILASIGSRTTTENVNLSFGVSATDIESTPALTTSTLPTGAGFTDNGDGTGAFTWTPTFLQSGTYEVTFYATDDSLAIDSEVVTVIVNDGGNQLPILAAIGARSTNENINLSFAVSATDIESTPSFTTSALPTGAGFTDNGNGIGSFSWTPTYIQSGIYSVTFYATDDSLAVDSETVSITVIDAGNQLPVLASIGSKSIPESVNLNFVIAAADAESIPSFTTTTLPAGASFVDNGNGTGAFDWTPTYLQTGIYNVTFYATDDSSAVDSEVVTITVTEAGNQPPVLVTIGARTTTENVNLNFGVSATDIESTPTLTTSALPAGAGFMDNGNGTGAFDWTPTFLQSGNYSVTFYATDDSLAIDSEVVSIIVNDGGNQLPILAAIGTQTTTENINLNFGVSATDIESTPTLTTSALPTGAIFVDNGNGTGAFDWTPTFLQSGTYGVTFYATDDSLAVDSEVVTIIVNDGGNQLPILTAIGPKSTNENINLSFGVSATDIESIPTLTTSALPSGAGFIDNGDGTGAFDWTPTFLQSGIYTVTFYATDDSLAVDSEEVTITVTEFGNQLPVLAAIGNRSTTENVNLNFGVSASDIESTPTLTTSALPVGAIFVDNGNGTGAFDWTPTFLQSGAFDVTFYATDDSLAVDSESITITVIEAGNQLPILTAIGAQSTTENVDLNFGITATDIESTPTLTTSALPAGATFVDNGNGTGAFSWTPTFLQSGTYDVTFYATDDSLAIDSETITITIIEAGNQLPVLAAIGPKTIPESVNLNFIIAATDAESIPSFTTSTLPAGAAFVDNGNGTGAFDWTPNYLQTGIYNVTFYAADDSAAVDSEVVTITVTEAGNQPPVLTTIGDKSTTENVNLNFGLTATDIESTPTLTTSTLPTGAAFVDNGNGTGAFTWTPTFLQSGTYDVTFYATDDSLSVDSESITITVIEAGNQLPILTAIGAQSTTENVDLNFGVTATDIESTPTLTTSALPAGAVFVDNGNGTGAFDWTPTFLQSGIYNVTFYATDDSLAVDSETITITVIEAGNQLPILAAIGLKSTTENINLSFGVSGTDIESIPTLTTSALPAGAAFVDNGNGTGAFNWTPTFLQSGTYDVTFYATDDSLAVDSEKITITVIEAGNQLPILAAIGTQTINENVNLNFGVSATDIESTPTLTTSALPTGAGFVDNGNGTGTFNWTPTFLQSGTYFVTFYATDDSLAVDSEVVTINVTEFGNQLPILATIGNKSTTENVNLNLGVSATDIESTPTLTTSALPAGAAFVDNGNGTGAFDWTPTFLQSGTYDVTFYATDDSLAVDSETITITVIEAGNQLPILAAIGAQSTTENINLNFGISATDIESIPTLTTSTLPAGAGFTDNGDGTGTFDWTPTFLQSGTYDVTFYATDDSLAVDSETITITVIDGGNQLPILAAIGAQSTAENVNLTFGVSATDIESIPALTTSALPTGAAFVDNADGSGAFTWTPTYLQTGIYTVTFYATDDSLAVDSEVVTITVTEAGNQMPVLASIGSQTTTENVNLAFGISATDIESTPTLTTSTLPVGAGFTDNGDGTGAFGWTPTFLQSGTYFVTFYATDDSSAVDSEVVTITVNDGGNQLPILAAIGSQSTNENVNLSFGVTATDIESIPTLTTSTLPAGAVFVDNGNGTGAFDWTPTFLQSGTYDVTFYATDDSLAVDSETITITVIEGGNQLPILAAIGAQSTAENVNQTFGVSATDIESIPTLTTSALPAGAVFVDNGNGTGAFDWTPTFLQSGTYDVTFYATDDSLAVDSETITITVIEAGNQLPILATISSQTTTEDVNLNFGVSATDIESIPVLTTSTLPLGAGFVDNGNGTGTFDWTPLFTQAGNYSVTFYATDDSAAVDSEVVSITVNDAGNQAPVLSPIGPKVVDENVNLNFGVSAVDADSTFPALSTSTLPFGAVFTDNNDGTGVFDWTPDYTQSGIYDITFYADDGTAIDSELVTITVNHVNLPPVADAGPDQFDVYVNSTVFLDGNGSSDFDTDPLTYSWVQVSGASVTLSDPTNPSPSFMPPMPDSYLFELTVYDGALFSLPDTVLVTAINASPPQAISDLAAVINADAIDLSWSEITLDTDGIPTTVAGYIIYRDTTAYFTPEPADSIGTTDPLTLTFTDFDINGVNVVGDTLHQYFYVVVAFDIYGNRSDVSNRVGEYDYQIIVTATTDFNLICVPFENTGITNAVQLITAIGSSNVNTVNNYQSASQNFESRFAAGFGVNFAVVPGGVYQVNAAAATIFSVAGSVPAPGSISYSLVTTSTTDFSFLAIPFDREADFRTAQDVLNNLPGSFNTLNRYIAGSQSYESRFAAGFGVNFPVKPGKPYQANAAQVDVFPGP